MFLVEIVSSGTELVDGSITDHNTAYIARQVNRLGLSVMAHHCVGDDVNRLSTLFRDISSKSDIAVVTGGLGPTSDDLTAEAAAMAAGVDLLTNSSALASIKGYFKQHDRKLRSSNLKQALLPRGADCLINPIGTAPGFAMKIGQCRFYFLPGVPREMQRMMTDEVLPRLSALAGKSSLGWHPKNIITYGLTESALGEKLADIGHEFPEVQLGYRIVFPEIHVKLRTQKEQSRDAATTLDRAVKWIAGRIGHCLVSTEGLSVSEAVGRLLRDRNATVAVAESCTGGLIASMLTDVPGSSDYFVFAAVTYSNESKIGVLGVSGQTIASNGAVHEETAAEMAEGVRAVSGADFGLATTGIAGPTGATEGKPVGTVCIGLASAGSTITRRHVFSFDDRAMNKRIFAVAAMDILRRALLNDKH